MSNLPPTPLISRHALGMPAGSVRAMLAFAVLIYLWVMALASGVKEGQLTGPLAQPLASTAFVYMQLVMVLVVAHFTVAHGKTIGGPVSKHSPLWMPRFSVRVIQLVAYFGLAYWTWQHRELFRTSETEPIIIVLAVVLAAFLIGHISTNVVRWMTGGYLPAWFLDVQAWFGLVAMILLLWIVIARLVINPGITEDTRKLSLLYTEPAMAAFVAFYFGARS